MFTKEGGQYAKLSVRAPGALTFLTPIMMLDTQLRCIRSRGLLCCLYRGLLLLDLAPPYHLAGVLSGEKQRIERNYNFTEIAQWFAAR
jgi:hypothetical protein